MPHGPFFSPRRSPLRSHALLETYPIRIMLGLAASLSVLVLLVRLPLYEASAWVGWGPRWDGPRISLQEVHEAKSARTMAKGNLSGAPITSFDAVAAAGAEAQEIGASEDPGADARDDRATDPSAHSAPERLAEAVQLHTLDQQPRAVGGIGNMYLKIGYPEAARRNNIEGRLTLNFVIEEDGTTSHVRITRPLHPLCDSAAVQAVRATRFLPGRRDGEPVRTRMSLPVLFKLVNDDTPLQATRSSPRRPER